MIFGKKKVVFGKKKSYIAEKPKERPFRLIKRFLQTESFENILSVPFERTEQFSEKSHSAEKNPKAVPFGLPSTFGSIRKFCGLVRDSNPRSPASQTPEN